MKRAGLRTPPEGGTTNAECFAPAPANPLFHRIVALYRLLQRPGEREAEEACRHAESRHSLAQPIQQRQPVAHRGREPRSSPAPASRTPLSFRRETKGERVPARETLLDMRGDEAGGTRPEGRGRRTPAPWASPRPSPLASRPCRRLDIRTAAALFFTPNAPRGTPHPSTIRRQIGRL